MVKILFICHGNICRSPMAEFVMKDLVDKAGLSGQFFIESAATSAEEIGNPVYPPARRKLAEYGISCEGKVARRLRREDYGKYDLLVGMDKENLHAIYRICGGDPAGKLRLLLDFAHRHQGPPRKPSEAEGRMGRGEARKQSDTLPIGRAERCGLCGDEVADPWYTGDFDATWRDVEEGCRGLLKALTKR